MNYKFEFHYDIVKSPLSGADVRQTSVSIWKRFSPNVEDAWENFASGKVTQNVKDDHTKEKARKAAITLALSGAPHFMEISHDSGKNIDSEEEVFVSGPEVPREERTEVWADYFARLIPPKDNVKRMDLSEFRELGYLQEVNRGFFHPHGLALEMAIDNGQFSISGVWDYREDPEGIIFVDGAIDPQKIDTVKAELKKHVDARVKLFDHIIQPYNETETDSAS